jgi:hypothetical protein
MTLRRLALALLALLAAAPRAFAGFADTPGKGMIILDVNYRYAWTEHFLDDHGRLTNLNADIVMYDPAGTPLGTISVPAYHFDKVLLTQLFYGFTENFAGGVVVPYFLASQTDLHLNWTSGAYAGDLGRPYSEQDFWAFAGSMGQQKPKDFRAGARIGDVVLGGIYNLKKTKRWQTAALGFVSTRSGSKADPELLGAIGTSGFELQTNGDVGLHLLGDYFLNPRISAGGELFYEGFFPRRNRSALGTVNPLLSYEGRYNGGTYIVVPGDWFGATAGMQFTLLRGTNHESWITRGKPAMQKSLPALFTVRPSLKYTRFLGNRYASASDYFDRTMNASHRAANRYTFEFSAAANFLRYGVPLGPYYQYHSQELVRGTNFIPVMDHTVGVQVYAAF